MENYLINATHYVQALLEEQKALDAIYAAYDNHRWPTAIENKRFTEAAQNRKIAHAEFVESLKESGQKVAHMILKTHKVARAMRQDWHAMNGGR
ncbi:hypothetical protein [Faecalibaculum rodentium]|uniref:hypothetical protein n=1 Tax=Faecalibaculum rodentium TaxID=1702221 RepID=UPI00272F7ED1|nr:hypothetical protein [Faecalibaculum rodentium]